MKVRRIRQSQESRSADEFCLVGLAEGNYPRSYSADLAAVGLLGIFKISPARNKSVSNARR